jgi:hypothetical protein
MLYINVSNVQPTLQSLLLDGEQLRRDRGQREQQTATRSGEECNRARPQTQGPIRCDLKKKISELLGSEIASVTFVLLVSEQAQVRVRTQPNSIAKKPS